MITDIDTALNRLAEMEDGVRDDLGFDEGEAILDAGGYADLVNSLAWECDDAILPELSRVTGVQIRKGM